MRLLYTSLVVLLVSAPGGLHGFPQPDRKDDNARPATSTSTNATSVGDENALTGHISTGVPGGRGRLPGGRNTTVDSTSSSSSSSVIPKPSDDAPHKPAAPAAAASDETKEGRQLPRTSAALNKPFSASSSSSTEGPSSSSSSTTRRTTTAESSTLSDEEKKRLPVPVSVLLPETGFNPEANRPIEPPAPGAAAEKKCVDPKSMKKAKAYFVLAKGKECKDALPETAKGLTVGKPVDQCKSSGEEIHICGLSIREVKRLAKIQFPDEHRNVDASKIDFAGANLEAGSFLQQCFVCQDPAASGADDSAEDDDD